MANDTTITVIGNLTNDPELRFTPSGVAVAKFRVASTPRSFDKSKNEWVDGEALFLPCTVWREYAEHVAESLTRGQRVVVVGRLVQRSFDDKEGNKRTIVELQVDEVGPALRYGTATFVKSGGGAGGGSSNGGARSSSAGRSTGAQGAGRPGQAAAPVDPWAEESPF